MKLNNLQAENKIKAYGFQALKDYAELSEGEGEVIVSTLSPAIMDEMGISNYHAPVLPRGAVFNTAKDVYKANLDVQYVSVLKYPDWDTVNTDKIIIVSQHQGTIDILRDMYPNAPVLSGNASPEEIGDLHVIGTLPPNLIQYCQSYRAAIIKDHDYKKEGDVTGQELLDRIVIYDPINVTIENGKEGEVVQACGYDIPKAVLDEMFERFEGIELDPQNYETYGGRFSADYVSSGKKITFWISPLDGEPRFKSRNTLCIFEGSEYKDHVHLCIHVPVTVYAKLATGKTKLLAQLINSENDRRGGE